MLTLTSKIEESLADFGDGIMSVDQPPLTKLRSARQHWRNSSKIKWTIYDEMRLASMDKLHRNCRQYYNNIHTVNVAFYNTSSAHSSKLTDIVENSVTLDKGVMWLRIENLNCLDKIEKRYRIHNLIHTFFSDSRVHSTFLPLSTGFLISICFFHWNENYVAVARKLFAYVGDGVIVTVRAINAFFEC